MRQKSGTQKEQAGKVIKDIRRATRKHYSAKENIRIGLEGSPGAEQNCLVYVNKRRMQSVLDEPVRSQVFWDDRRVKHLPRQSGIELTCYPTLDRPEPELPRVVSHAAESADEPFMSDIGGLLPIALCGRTVL